MIFAILFLGFFAECRYGMYCPMMRLLASSAILLHGSQQPGFLLNRLREHGGLGTPHQKPMTVLLSVSSSIRKQQVHPPVLELKVRRM